MSLYVIILIIIGSILVLTIISYFIFTFFLARKIYLKHLHRKDKDTWGRHCSWMTNKLQVRMYEIGLEWGEKNKSYKKDVHIINEGLNLYGEYFDFGYDKVAFIHQGRTEACMYSYFFAKPYQDAGYNILVIDPRAHGYSDGEYNTIGFEECKDVIAWANFLHDTYHIDTIVMHGICIGSAAALYAMIRKDCPSNIKALIAEGMYPDFYDSFKNHMIVDKRPIFPVLQECDFWMRHFTHHTMKYGPKDCIDKLDKPLLLLHSKEDLYSLPARAQELYDKCGSKAKKLVWFDKGAHSHIRAVTPELYDKAIQDFLKENNL